ncbi:MAG: glucose 1-dehydrogenase [Saprospiraceae bacterium]|nr:glucose 1-dehydrogenase [Saprospiraceae bacterium]
MNIFDKFQLKGKVALVTGASKGIGEGIALALGQAGARVVVSSRKQEAVDETALRLQSEGIEVLPVAANTGQLDQLQNLVEQTLAAFGGVDILINNAATNPVFGPVEQTDGRAFDKIMEVNLKGPFELAKLVLPSMQARGGGAVINISSIGGISPEPFLGIYSVSKSALLMLTKVMAKEWGQYGIRANAICPGLIKTKFSQALWDNEAILKHTLRDLPAARVGTVEEISGLALFLASDASAYCTGAVFTADGGHTI